MEICQYKVNESIGNTFAEYARRFLRKDPDIILIGEIRDEDTAEACFRAAMTGHLVFSTLHTNDSVGALQRLSNLGVNNAIAAEAILAVHGTATGKTRLYQVPATLRAGSSTAFPVLS